jgi:hypothetical protein
MHLLFLELISDMLIQVPQQPSSNYEFPQGSSTASAKGMSTLELSFQNQVALSIDLDFLVL